MRGWTLIETLVVATIIVGITLLLFAAKKRYEGRMQGGEAKHWRVLKSPNTGLCYEMFDYDGMMGMAEVSCRELDR